MANSDGRSPEMFQRQEDGQKRVRDPTMFAFSKRKLG